MVKIVPVQVGLPEGVVCETVAILETVSPGDVVQPIEDQVLPLREKLVVGSGRV